MNFPEKGFYYHYKHDPSGSFENYAYEVLGVGLHTEMPHEDALDPEEGVLVVYRPLYESAFVYQHGKIFDIRPLKMFMEDIENASVKMKRFTQIKDNILIERLNNQVRKLYE